MTDLTGADGRSSRPIEERSAGASRLEEIRRRMAFVSTIDRLKYIP